jgi:hypothetical protein
MSNLDLPERINVIRTVTYDVPKIVGDLQEMNMEDIDLDVILEYIQEWVVEDLTAPLSRHDIVYQDENGEEL